MTSSLVGMKSFFVLTMSKGHLCLHKNELGECPTSNSLLLLIVLKRLKCEI